MHNQIEDAGAPYEMALQMTTFADKFTILRKRKILPEFSGMSLRRYQFRARSGPKCHRSRAGLVERVEIGG